MKRPSQLGAIVPFMNTCPAHFHRTAAARLECVILMATVPALQALDLSYNTGSLGTAADGTHAAGVVLDQPGAVTAYLDYATGYSGGNRTTIPFLPQVNPAAGSPFTVEFWAWPTNSDNDDAPLANRIATGNRSGWVFFQRTAAVGWNFRMYNGVSSGLAWDLEGGSATLNTWSHVVAVWNGSGAKLYVNGTVASETSKAGATGSYNPSTSAIFSVGALFDGLSGYNGLLDEVAFYPAALTATQIHDHFVTAASATTGAYSSLVLSESPLIYLQQNPPTVRIGLNGQTPQISFTGILAESPDLLQWTDLNATSPYTPPVLLPGQFFRAHR